MLPVNTLLHISILQDGSLSCPFWGHCAKFSSSVHFPPITPGQNMALFLPRTSVVKNRSCTCREQNRQPRSTMQIIEEDFSLRWHRREIGSLTLYIKSPFLWHVLIQKPTASHYLVNWTWTQHNGIRTTELTHHSHLWSYQYGQLPNLSEKTVKCGLFAF